MKSIIIISIFMLLLVACSDNGTNVDNWIYPISKNQSVSEAQQLIIGKWERYNILASGINGFDCTWEKIEFSNHSNVNFYQSDTLLSSAAYFILIAADVSTLVLGIGNNAACPFRVNEQYLVTDYRADSGPAVVYRKCK